MASTLSRSGCWCADGPRASERPDHKPHPALSLPHGGGEHTASGLSFPARQAPRGRTDLSCSLRCSEEVCPVMLVKSRVRGHTAQTLPRSPRELRDAGMCSERLAAAAQGGSHRAGLHRSADVCAVPAPSQARAPEHGGGSRGEAGHARPPQQREALSSCCTGLWS